MPRWSLCAPNTQSRFWPSAWSQVGAPKNWKPWDWQQQQWQQQTTMFFSISPAPAAATQILNILWSCSNHIASFAFDIGRNKLRLSLTYSLHNYLSPRAQKQTSQSVLRWIRLRHSRTEKATVAPVSLLLYWPASCCCCCCWHCQYCCYCHQCCSCLSCCHSAQKQRGRLKHSTPVLS